MYDPMSSWQINLDGSFNNLCWTTEAPHILHHCIKPMLPTVQLPTKSQNTLTGGHFRWCGISTPQKQTQNQSQSQTAAPQPTIVLMPSTTPYDYKAKLQRITTELESTLKMKFEKTLVELNEKFEKHLKAIKQQFTRQFKQLKPLATNQAELTATQSDQAWDISQLTMSTLMSQVSSILDRLPHLPVPASHPMLVTSIGRS